MAYSREDVAWAGGLFEGEGSFSFQSRSDRKAHYALARLSMSDEDVVRRFADVVGFGSVNGPYQYRPDRKPMFVWTVQGLERVQAFGAAVWPWLGTRRRTRLAEILRGHGERTS